MVLVSDPGDRSGIQNDLSQAWVCAALAWTILAVATTFPSPMAGFPAPQPSALATLAAGFGALGLCFASRKISRGVGAFFMALAAAAVFFAAAILGPLNEYLFIGLLIFWCLLLISSLLWMLYSLVQAVNSGSRQRQQMTTKEMLTSLLVIVLCHFAVQFGVGVALACMMAGFD